MTQAISHGKRITETIYDGEVVRIDEEAIRELFTTQQLLLKHIIDGLSVVTGGESRKLTIEVSIDSKDRYKLTQRWRVQ